MNIRVTELTRCKDCKWFRKNWFDPGFLSKCASPANEVSTWDGKPIIDYADRSRKIGPCGRDAKLFEPK